MSKRKKQARQTMQRDVSNGFGETEDLISNEDNGHFHRSSSSSSSNNRIN